MEVPGGASVVQLETSQQCERFVADDVDDWTHNGAGPVFNASEKRF